MNKIFSYPKKVNPNAGKAKLRFIHLNGFLNNSISIKTGRGTELANASTELKAYSFTAN